MPRHVQCNINQPTNPRTPLVTGPNPRSTLRFAACMIYLICVPPRHGPGGEQGGGVSRRMDSIGDFGGRGARWRDGWVEGWMEIDKYLETLSYLIQIDRTPLLNPQLPIPITVSTHPFSPVLLFLNPSVSDSSFLPSIPHSPFRPPFSPPHFPHRSRFHQRAPHARFRAWKETRGAVWTLGRAEVWFASWCRCWRGGGMGGEWKGCGGGEG